MHYERLNELIAEYRDLSDADSITEERDQRARGRAVSIVEMLLLTGMDREIAQRSSNEAADKARAGA